MRDTGRRPMGRLCCWVLVMVAASGFRLPAFGEPVPQSGPATTTVTDRVYMADGSAAQGSLIITWPAFVTASGAVVAAGTTNTTLAANGTFSVALVPNVGATPAGVYYTVVYQLGPGEVKTEYWRVATASPANLAMVRTTPGSGTADAPVSMQYVNSGLATKANDNAVVHLSGTETISGAKTFSAAPSVPAPASSGQVANKGYVDSSVANVGAGAFLPTAGGTMTGPITLPGAPAAPMQAATKQYVDTGLAAKSDLVSGLVPASELGTGSATTGSCLQGNGTSSGTWGTCGSGGGTGNLSTTPTASQNIAQPMGTQFSTNNLANIRYVTGSWNWAQTPPDNLGTAGNHTIHLSPCPQGMDTTSSANGYTYRVYISGIGTPEAVTVTGGSCAAGTSSGTITVTTAYGHGAGYTVGSASTGIQEAWNDAWVNDQGGSPNANSQAAPYVKLVADTLYGIYSTVYLRGRGGVLDGTGALIACSTRDRCIYVGTTGGVSYHKLYNLSGTSTLNVDGVQVASVSAASGTYTVTTASSHPFVAGDTVDCEYYSQTASQHFVSQVLAAGLTATQFEAQFGTASFSAGTNTFGFCNILNTFIENNSDHVTLQDLNLFQAYPSTGTGYFSYGVVNDNDQQFIIERATNRGSAVLKNSANWPIGAFVYQRADQGNAGITYLHNSEFTNVNCVTGGGNGMVISDTVCQGFPFFGIRYFGGLQPITIENVYQETSPAVSNPLYGIAAQMGNLVQGGFGSKILGAFPMGGWEPIFASGGSTQRNYWVVVQSSTQGAGPMMFIGSAQPANGITSIPLQWPSVELQNVYGSLGTVTWDVLVTTGGSSPAPYGTGSYAVATGISGSCGTNGICSYTDTQAATSGYTVPTAGFMPVFWFWPVTLVLNNTTVYADFLPSNPFIVASQGTQGLAATAGMCRSGNPSFELTPVMVQCLSGDGAYGSGIFATLFQQTAPANNGPAVNSKGRLNLSQAIAPPNDLITLADSNLAKTLATAGNRPPNDAGDMAIGVDQTGGLAQRAATSISSYINTVPSGTNWLERLTAAGKTFNVPLAVNGNLTVSGGTVTLPVTGTGSQCLHVSAAGVLSGTGADCGNGSGTGTVNSGVTSQVAMYSGNGTAVSGDSALTDNGTTLNYTGSGGIAATAGAFSGNVTVNGQLLVAGPWTVSSPIPGTAMGPAGAGTSALGISNDGNFYISTNGGTPQKVATSATSSYFSNLTQEDANDVGQYLVGETTANPENLHVYSSYTNSSNWQRTSVGFDPSSGYAVLRSESSAAGQAPGLGFWINSGLKWVIDASSNLKPWADETYNIGTFSAASGIGLRPATVFAAGNSNSDSGFELGKFANNSYELCNDTSTGTVINGLAVLTANGCAVKPGSAATSGVIGVVIANPGTSGTTTLARTGSAYCSFDATPTVVGDYVVPSSVASNSFYPWCHDAGSTLPTGIQVLGRVLQATPGGTTAQMFFDMPGSSLIAQGGGAPTASPTFTGTVTLPDGTTDSSSGISLGSALSLPNGSTASTQTTSDSSTKLATTAYVKNQGYLSSPTGTQGLSLAETASGSGTAYATAGAELKCDAGFSGADNALKIQACINALGSAASGRVDASGFTGSFTVNNNLIPPSVTPSALKVKLGGATIITNVPQILGTRVELEGTGAQGIAGDGMTFIQAGPSFPAGCGANDVNNPSCTGTITNAISSGGTSVSIGGTSSKWSSGTIAQTLAPGCTIGIGTFNSDGSIANGAWGVVKAGSTVTDTSITVAVLSVIGTGSGAGASYAKFCDLILTADGSSNPAFGVGLDHIGADCNGVDGCNAFGNYYAEEKTYVHFFQGRGYVNGYLIHNETSGAQNAGDFSEINGGPGSGASANTIDIYDAVNGGSRSKWMLNTITHAVSGACANPPNVAVVLEDLGTEWSNNHQEVCGTSSSIALQVGQNSSVVKAPVFFVQGPLNCHDCSVHNNNLGGNGAQTMVAVSSVTPQDGITVYNNTANTSATTNLLTDGTNTITYACNGGFLGHYETDSYGTPRTDAKAACVTTATVFSNGNVTVPGTLAVSGTTTLAAATATTPSVGDSSTRVATTAYVQTQTAGAGVGWVTANRGSGTGAIPSSSANKALLWGILLDKPITTTQVTFQAGTTADNTSSNNYDLGLYNSAGTLVLNVSGGSLHGSTFAPSVPSPVTLNWQQGSTALQPGQYYLAYYTSLTTSPPSIYGGSIDQFTFYKGEGGGTCTTQSSGGFSITPRSGGILPTSISPPSNSYSWSACTPQLWIH